MSLKKVILLSTVQSIHANSNEVFIPLSIMAIGSALVQEGFEPILIDVQVEPNWQRILKKALMQNPLLFGVSCLTGPSILGALEGIEIVRKQSPDVPIVWGGYHATQTFQSIFKENLVDYVVTGPGEEAIVKLANALSRNSISASLNNKLADVPNLVYKNNSELVINPFAMISDINALPSMRYDLVNVNEYFSRERRIIQYISSYGCPHACTFCTEPTQSQRMWRGLAPKKVANEIAILWEKYKPDRISFVDPNFSSRPQRVIEFVKEMKRHQKIYAKMNCNMRATDVLYIAKRLDLNELKEVGFARVFLGLETGSNRMLNSLKKNMTANDALIACQMLSEAGIETFASFMHDLPGETMEDSQKTFRLIENLCRLETHKQSHHLFTPYPTTEIYNHLLSDSDIQKEENTQLQWASTSTYYGSELWTGRHQFRKVVLRKLRSLQQEYPHILVALPYYKPDES